MMIDEIMIRGTETSNRNNVNFIPRNDASKTIIGILQTADAPTYVKTTLNFAPFLYKTAAIGKATYNPPTVVPASRIPQKYPRQDELSPRCFSIVSLFIQTSNNPIRMKAIGTILSIDKAKVTKFSPIISPTE